MHFFVLLRKTVGTLNANEKSNNNSLKKVEGVIMKKTSIFMSAVLLASCVLFGMSDNAHAETST